MAAKKKKRVSINLLPTEGFKSTIMGRALQWALTSFRVMVIVCELIVMGAFLSRFWLDARNSDLNEEINIAKAQVMAYEPVETEFRLMQKRLLIASQLYSEENVSLHVDSLSQYLPTDVFLNSISVIDDSFQIKATSLSERSILQYIVNLESLEIFDDIVLSQISSSIDNESYMTFTLSTKLK